MNIAYSDDHRGRDDDWTASLYRDGVWLLEAYGATKSEAHTELLTEIRALRDELEAVAKQPLPE
jgi:hypothetical protein